MKVNRKTFLKILLVTVLINYAAQIPYYWHQYYTPSRFLPSLFGTILLGITLAWFIVAYQKLAHGHKAGYYLMLAFLAVEFLFYLQTQISQYLLVHRILLHVYRPDGGLLFVVFGIGYVNFIAAAYFIAYLITNRNQFVLTSGASS